MSRYLSRRQAALREGWLCKATRVIEQFPDTLGLNKHECGLAREHYGPHICWCETAWEANGSLFRPQPLPGIDPRLLQPRPRHRGSPYGAD